MGTPRQNETMVTTVRTVNIDVNVMIEMTNTVSVDSIWSLDSIKVTENFQREMEDITADQPSGPLCLAASPRELTVQHLKSVAS